MAVARDGGRAGAVVAFFAGRVGGDDRQRIVGEVFAVDVGVLFAVGRIEVVRERGGTRRRRRGP